MSQNSLSLPPIFFNHLYVVLDDKTYHAIIGSDFLQIAFPGKEKRATLTAAGETWSGTYFYCQDNYLEFFGSGNGPVTGKASRSGHWQSGAQEGWAGLAFSADRIGGVAAVRQALQEKLGYEPFYELRQMHAREKIINWFYQVKLAEQLGLGSFEAWVMEYHPDVFAHKGIALPENGELSRMAYLSPWNKNRTVLSDSSVNKMETEISSAHSASASDDESDSAHLPSARKMESGSRTPLRTTPRTRVLRPEAPRPPVFSRVIGATLHLDHSRAERFASVLELFGYAKHEEDGIFSLAAHGFTLRILPEEAGPDGFRISSLRLSMARPSVAPMTFVFAPGSRLILNEDMTADWQFGI
jgi:hypothetical protein